MEANVRWRRYVAVGDSTTEGLNDLADDGTYRGWADRLAYRLAELQGRLEYANLAIRGRTTALIKHEQLPAAVDLEPDLATVVAGMNDLLRPSFDAGRVTADIGEMFAALRALRATVVTFTIPKPGPQMPISRVLVPRVLRFNRKLRDVARETGTLVLDLAQHPVASDPRLWDVDRLHANSEGHRRIAAGLAALLGLPGSDGSWQEPLPPLPRRSIRSAVGADLVWMRTHLGPWAWRHLWGRSSGDGVTAKRPLLQPVVIEPHEGAPWPDR